MNPRSNNPPAKSIAGQRQAVARLRARLHEVNFSVGGRAREAYLAVLLLGLFLCLQ